jgi:NADH-quinone oxidoreductase subunit J
MPTLRPPSTTLETVVFVFFAALAVLGAFGTVLSRNPIRAAVGLFVHIIALAALYLNLGAHFLGVIQLLVYAGAVVVLFVFVIMLLGPAATSPQDGRGIGARGAAVVGVAGIAGGLLMTLQYVRLPMPERTDSFGTMNVVGSFLFKQGIIPFEMISVTLVIAIVGAFAIARGKHERRALADRDPTAPEKLAEGPEPGEKSAKPSATKSAEGHS